MAYDATKSSTFELFGLNDAQLRARGLSPVQIQELRSVQRAAPAARTVEEVRELVKTQEAAPDVQAEPVSPSEPRRTRGTTGTTGMASGTHTDTAE